MDTVSAHGCIGAASVRSHWVAPTCQDVHLHHRPGFGIHAAPRVPSRRLQPRRNDDNWLAIQHTRSFVQHKPVSSCHAFTSRSCSTYHQFPTHLNRFGMVRRRSVNVE
jgi:hypothetical protein